MQNARIRHGWKCTCRADEGVVRVVGVDTLMSYCSESCARSKSWDRPGADRCGLLKDEAGGRERIMPREGKRRYETQCRTSACRVLCPFAVDPWLARCYWPLGEVVFGSWSGACSSRVLTLYFDAVCVLIMFNWVATEASMHVA